MKRIIAINDISCLGRCSLTVILPVISSCGIECTVLPTALLSSHTGGLDGYTFRDLSSDIPSIVDQWVRLHVDSAAIYCGYLADPAQAEVVLDAIHQLKQNGTLIFVDPVMGDHGKLYSNITPDMVAAMEKICREADVLVPNMTEAHQLLGKEFREGPYHREYIGKLLREFQNRYPQAETIFSGVMVNEHEIGCAYLDEGKETIILHRKLEGEYHGTGDIFASVLLSGIVNGLSLKKAIRTAGEFVADCIEITMQENQDEKYGVLFESLLHTLKERME
ncbi:MAG: pyridoxamine kinase [Erysipelotrichaceae bacterium]|nr:pyridoxamine kinase [Erysipelotrichaceae bacterium]